MHVTTVNESKSPRVVWEGVIGINSSRTLVRLQTACLTAPESSCVFLLLCSPSMLLAIACYRGEPKCSAAMGLWGNTGPYAGGGSASFQRKCGSWSMGSISVIVAQYDTCHYVIFSSDVVRYHVRFIYLWYNKCNQRSSQSCKTLFITKVSSFGPFSGQHQTCVWKPMKKISKFLDLRPTTPKHEMFYHFKSHLSM